MRGYAYVICEDLLFPIVFLRFSRRTILIPHNNELEEHQYLLSAGEKFHAYSLFLFIHIFTGQDRLRNKRHSLPADRIVSFPWCGPVAHCAFLPKNKLLDFTTERLCQLLSGYSDWYTHSSDKPYIAFKCAFRSMIMPVMHDERRRASWSSKGKLENSFKARRHEYE